MTMTTRELEVHEMIIGGTALAVAILLVMYLPVGNLMLTGNIIYQAQSLDDYLPQVLNGQYIPLGSIQDDTIPGYETKEWSISGTQFISGMDITNSNRTFTIIYEPGTVISSQAQAGALLSKYTTIKETFFNTLSNQYTYIEQLTNSTFIISTTTPDSTGTYIAVFDEVGQEELQEDANDLVRGFEDSLPKVIATSCEFPTENTMTVDLFSTTTSTINTDRIITVLNNDLVPFSSSTMTLEPSNFATITIQRACSELQGELQISIPQTSNSKISIAEIPETFGECGCDIIWRKNSKET